MNPLDARTVPLAGRHLIEASAGTGKTWTITTLVVRLVVEAAIPIDRVLVVTFTRAATSELRDRIRRRLQEALAALDGKPKDDVLADLVARWDVSRARDRIEAAIADLDLASISTIHGFCQRVLRESAFESASGFERELVEDAAPFHARVAQDVWTRLTWQADPTWLSWLDVELPFDRVVELTKAALRPMRSRILPETPPAPLEDEGVALRRAWHAAHAQFGSWDAAAVIDALRRCPGRDKKVLSDGQCYKHGSTLHGVLQAVEPVFVTKPAKAMDAACELMDPARHADVLSDPVAGPLFRLAGAWRVARVAFVRARVRACRLLVDEAPAALRTVLGPRRDVRFFDDLVGELAHAVTGPDGARLCAAIRGSYSAALVDEFQDTDPAQFVVFDTVFRGPDTRLFLIGDPKQAIYGFRGADLHAYLGARDGVPASDRWSLATNHRSDGPLVDAVNLLYTRRPNPFGDPRIEFVPVSAAQPDPRLAAAGRPVAPLRFLLHPTSRASNLTRTRDVPRQVAAAIVALLAGTSTLGGNPIEPGDIAVLVAKRHQGDAFVRELSRLRVPVVRRGQAQVFSQPEAVDVLALMEALIDPADLSRVRAALATPLLGADADAIAALDDDEDELQQRLLDLRRWHDEWSRRGFAHLFQLVLAETHAVPRLLGQRGGERRLTNLRHIAELLHAAERRLGLQPVTCASWLRHELSYAGRDDGPEALRLESDARAVQIVTMHSSKGLEYPVVFLPYLASAPSLADDGFTAAEFHDPDHRHAATLQLDPDGNPAHQRLADRERAEEQLRLVYVALTRARHLCVVSWGAFHDMQRSPLWALLGAASTDADPKDADALHGFARDLAGTSPHLGTTRVPTDDALFRGLPDSAPPSPPPKPPRTFARDVRISSFSALTAASHDKVHADASERDVDAASRPEPTLPGSPLTLATFPRGAKPGTAYHAVLEDLDFALAGTEAARAHVAGVLATHGLGAAEHVDAVHRSVAELVDTPLGEGAPRLREVARGERLDELDFTLPVGVALSPFTADRLADVLAAHLRPELAGPVSARVRSLDFSLHGALKGFVDLAFRHDGRWYLVDYKTNHLGDALDDYGAAGLDRAMIEGDYVVQYLVYAVALSRFLRMRVRDFNWTRDVGGVRYLFVRGCTPATGATRGVFVDRPSEALIDALDAVFRGAVP